MTPTGKATRIAQIGDLMIETHSLLHRQIRRHLGTDASISEPWMSLIRAVDDAYRQGDEDRSDRRADDRDTLPSASSDPASPRNRCVDFRALDESHPGCR